MSDTWQGPGWWLASDGKWYPPEQTPGPLPQTQETQRFVVPGDSAPAAIPASGSSVPPAVPGDGPADPQTGGRPSDASEVIAGWSPPAPVGYGPPPADNAYGPPPAAVGYGPPPGSPGYPPPDNGYGPPPAAVDYGPPPGSPGYPPPDNAYGPPPGSPGYGSMPAPGYGYQPGYPGYGYGAVAKTNGLAIASLVCSLLWVFGLSAVLAIVFGFIARSQIKRSGGGQRGNGLALAGIIIGFISVIATVLIIVAAAAFDHHCHQDGNCTFTTLNTGN